MSQTYQLLQFFTLAVLPFLAPEHMVRFLLPHALRLIRSFFRNLHFVLGLWFMLAGQMEFAIEGIAGSLVGPWANLGIICASRLFFSAHIRQE